MMYFIRPEPLRKFIIDALRKVKLSEQDAALCAENLLYADLRGIDGEGLVWLGHYIERIRQHSILPDAVPEFEPVSSAMGIVDGHHAMGAVSAHRAVTEAIQLARKAGVGVVVVQNGGHCGAPGFYGEIAAQQGMVALVVTNTEPVVAPHGGHRPFFGSNPMAFVCPTGTEQPIAIGMLTSMVSSGKIEAAKMEHRKIPKEWAVDAMGKPTDDPHFVEALLPLAGAVGHDLGLAANLLTSLLTGAAYGPDILKMRGNEGKPPAMSQFVLVLDVSHLVPRMEFLMRVRQIQKRLQAEPAAGAQKPFAPGEAEALIIKKRMGGGIPISEKTWHELEDAARDLQIEKPGQGQASS